MTEICRLSHKQTNDGWIRGGGEGGQCSEAGVAIRGLSMQEQFPVTSSVWDSNRALVTGDRTPVNEPYAYLERLCICNIKMQICHTAFLHG